MKCEHCGKENREYTGFRDANDNPIHIGDVVAWPCMWFGLPMQAALAFKRVNRDPTGRVIMGHTYNPLSEAKIIDETDPAFAGIEIDEPGPNLHRKKYKIVDGVVSPVTDIDVFGEEGAKKQAENRRKAEYEMFFGSNQPSGGSSASSDVSR